MKKQVSIWFIIGLQLAILGAIIAVVSIYSLYVPPATHTVLEEWHAGIAWGVLMLALGLFYTLRFRPK